MGPRQWAVRLGRIAPKIQQQWAKYRFAKAIHESFQLYFLDQMQNGRALDT